MDEADVGDEFVKMSPQNRLIKSGGSESSAHVSKSGGVVDATEEGGIIGAPGTEPHTVPLFDELC